MKKLFHVEIQADHLIGGKKNLFSIAVSSWVKKDEVKPHRTFNFSTKTREDLYHWVITLNFLRIKATYEEFSSQFGLINLPLKHEVKKAKKKFKQKFKVAAINQDGKIGYSLPNTPTTSLYNSIARKSVINSSKSKVYEKSESLMSRNAYSSLMRRSSMFPYNSRKDFIDENNDKYLKLKKVMNITVMKSIIAFIGFMQDVIFNVESISVGQDKVIAIPKLVKAIVDQQYEDEGENLAEEFSLTRSNSKLQWNNENSVTSFCVSQSLADGENNRASARAKGKRSILKNKEDSSVENSPSPKLKSVPVIFSEPAKKVYSEFKQSNKDQDYLDVDEVDDKFNMNGGMKSEATRKTDPITMRNKMKNNFNDNYYEEKKHINRNVISFNAEVESNNKLSERSEILTEESNKEKVIISNKIFKSSHPTINTGNLTGPVANSIYNSNRTSQSVTKIQNPPTNNSLPFLPVKPNQEKPLEINTMASKGIYVEECDLGSIKMINKLKNLNVSVEDSEDDFFNFSKSIKALEMSESIINPFLFFKPNFF